MLPVDSPAVVVPVVPVTSVGPATVLPVEPLVSVEPLVDALVSVEPPVSVEPLVEVLVSVEPLVDVLVSVEPLVDALVSTEPLVLVEVLVSLGPLVELLVSTEALVELLVPLDVLVSTDTLADVPAPLDALVSTEAVVEPVGREFVSRAWAIPGRTPPRNAAAVRIARHKRTHRRGRCPPMPLKTRSGRTIFLGPSPLTSKHGPGFVPSLLAHLPPPDESKLARRSDEKYERPEPRCDCSRIG